MLPKEVKASEYSSEWFFIDLNELYLKSSSKINVIFTCRDPII